MVMLPSERIMTGLYSGRIIYVFVFWNSSGFILEDYHEATILGRSWSGFTLWGLCLCCILDELSYGILLERLSSKCILEDFRQSSILRRLWSGCFLKGLSSVRILEWLSPTFVVYLVLYSETIVIELDSERIMIGMYSERIIIKLYSVIFTFKVYSVGLSLSLYSGTIMTRLHFLRNLIVRYSEGLSSRCIPDDYHEAEKKFNLTICHLYTERKWFQ